MRFKQKIELSRKKVGDSGYFQVLSVQEVLKSSNHYCSNIKGFKNTLFSNTVQHLKVEIRCVYKSESALNARLYQHLSKSMYKHVYLSTISKTILDARVGILSKM